MPGLIPITDFIEKMERAGLILVGPWYDETYKCWVCGERALFGDIYFIAPCCGAICQWAAWEALRLHDTPWRAW